MMSDVELVLEAMTESSSELLLIAHQNGRVTMHTTYSPSEAAQCLMQVAASLAASQNPDEWQETEIEQSPEEE